MGLPLFRRYGLGARFYDVLSMEQPVYRPGRIVAINQLQLEPGDSVLDVGCGTGLNFPHLRNAVGADGRVVGVDASEAMLKRAELRVQKHRWGNVDLRQGDAGRLRQVVGDKGPFNAVLFTYSLSIIPEWERALAEALSLLVGNGRIGVVDLASPTGWGRVFGPLAALACATGGVDGERHPWEKVESETTNVFRSSVRSGHVQIAVGTVG